MNASGDQTMRSPGSEFVMGMKRTSVTAAVAAVRPPSSFKSPAGGKKSAKKANGTASIPKQSPTSPPPVSRITRSASSPTSRRLDSFVDVVTDRVIDKLCRLDLASDSLAAAAASAMPAAGDEDNQIPLIDLKHNSVVMITVTAKRPVPGRKMQSFRGMVHLNTNDIRLSEDVDRLLEAARKKTVRKGSPTSRPRKGTAEESGGELSAAGKAKDEEDSGSEDSNSEYPDSGIGKGANSQNKADVAAAAEGTDVTTASSQSTGSHADEAEENAANSGSGEDQPSTSKSRGSRTSPVQRDPRGRKVGSTINCKKLQSLETRLTDRISKLKRVIESNGYDFSESQVVDQTEIARVTHGIDLIAFQRLMIFRRAKTPVDLMYGVEKGMIVDEPFLSSPLTPF